LDFGVGLRHLVAPGHVRHLAGVALRRARQLPLDGQQRGRRLADLGRLTLQVLDELIERSQRIRGLLPLLPLLAPEAEEHVQAAAYPNGRQRRRTRARWSLIALFPIASAAR